MMSARKATPSLLKIKGLFWKRLRRHNFSPWRHKKMLSRDSIYNVNLGIDQSLVTLSFLWEKLS